ncbi:MAG: transglutaminase domain-containing protein, partial [Oscillospiraceae bacterium]|nr:transglutaminase domain-containing protein [Oscillospiraceae bacterium]
GPRRVIPYEVMTVTADFSGSLYLRGQDYDKYDGMSWTSTLDRAENLPSSYYFAHRGTVTIATKQTMDVLYLPGYLNRDYRLTDGNLKNTGLQTEYQWSVSKLGMDPSAFVSSYVEDYSDVKQYLELPEATHEWADAYVLPFIGGHSAETVQAIVDHVGNSARYSLNTRRMDDSCGDFAQWFLEDSDTGYCVHFATAATVLLRAAGIPARYVTGYMVNCEAGETITVESDRAHAWVEYFDPIARAWIIAEPTPPDLSEDEPEDESVTAPPPVTQPLTEPAETETAAPAEPVTRPIQIGGIPIDGKEESRILEILGWIILAAAVWAAIILQRILRIALRRRTLTGGPNRRALGLWQDVERISAFMKREPPEELLELAQKAKFSQYELTTEELRQFTAWLKEARKELRSRPVFQRIWCRYVLALW